MKSIAFIDLEVQPDKEAIVDLGAVGDSGGTFHSRSLSDFLAFIRNADYLCGHNIIRHDLSYLEAGFREAEIASENVIDTLYLSALLFPRKPYHALVKDEKLQTGELNNPLTDAIKSKELFFDEAEAFRSLDDTLKSIFSLLLRGQKEFGAFFRYMGCDTPAEDPAKIIKDHFRLCICENADVGRLAEEHPIALAFSLAVIDVNDRFSITPPWVLKNYPEVELAMDVLRNRHCLAGCRYCNQRLDARRGLKKYFGFDSFKLFDGKPLQENAVKAAIDNKSLLAIFPTGGGKSIAFQVPALMSGENVQGLTVVISPLLSLMKDQVDNLEKAGITDAVTINGLLDPIERAQSVKSVRDGSASILYISPETLRSKTIENLLLGRRVVRFVIDEAHCFSAWGQDFRVDYLYIGDFIKSLQEKKNLLDGIPVSCFTATAKPQVIEDIREYFREKLAVGMEVFNSSATRENLVYKVLRKTGEEKYITLRNLLQGKECPTIVYVSRTKTADDLAKRLTRDGFPARPYHGKMDTREKTANQNAFIAGEVPTIVATSAFGMGVDKKDVGRVVHYEISDSLENYIQEAGRAGRDETMKADCYILFCEDDLDNHFSLLNQSKLNIKEIQQVWKAIKDITKARMTASQSALEIAREAGWDDAIANIETRVTTAIAALEKSGYIRRRQNMPRVFADSICCRNAGEAIERINRSRIFDEKEKEDAARIIRRLISARSLSRGKDNDGESRVDWLSDQLGIEKRRTIDIINLLREEGILADAKDLRAYIKKTEKDNRSLQIFEAFRDIEKFLLSVLEEQETTYNVKELNERAEEAGCRKVTTEKVRRIFNYWKMKKLVNCERAGHSVNHVRLAALEPREKIAQRLDQRYELSRFVTEYLYARSLRPDTESEEETLVTFSVKELKDNYNKSNALLKNDLSISDFEEALLYLSRIGAVNIEGGFLVLYNPMTIERLEKDARRRFKKEDYSDLDRHYNNKKQQIHIVGEYARTMLDNYRKALEFVNDYFRLNYTFFLRKYFKGRKADEIHSTISPGKFRQLFGELNPTQLDIIKDSEHPHIAVVAGPGSGKTRVLVHKLASLILMEDVKHEQLLMLTFSRAAATEFKKRLHGLIGSAANFIEIKTFHSYCFDLLGRVGNVERSDMILREAIERIREGEVEPGRITKTVLVIDEAQDMDADVYALIQTLMDHNEDMRVIAVGDDDQNIFEFRGSRSRYMKRFIEENQAVPYELLENYRSKKNLVDFTNRFATCIRERLKKNDVVSKCQDNGEIRVVRHFGNNLVVPVAEDILGAELAGSTAVLTQTNDEALYVTGLLRQKGVSAELIQSNEGFRLRDISEIRFFMNQLAMDDPVSPTIGDGAWETAKRELKAVFGGSEMLETCQNIIRDFETVSPNQKYKTDFDVFLDESELEYFYPASRETILASTIHKAKGREYDNVYLLLNGCKLNTEEKKRLIYVAMTRAKNNLTIHLNGLNLDRIRVENMARAVCRTKYGPPGKLTMHLGHKDVVLDYFYSRRHVLGRLQSGAPLVYRDGFFHTEQGNRILKPSQSFRDKLQDLGKNGYMPGQAKVNFIVYWKKKEPEREEIKIVLPELQLERKQTEQSDGKN